MIFNSLGSNYDLQFVIKSLFSFPDKNDYLKLKDLLKNKYDGSVELLYKGREAIKLALEISGLPKGSKVGVNGFTCFVVNQAITEAGFTPVYLDIGDWDLNFDIKNLEKHKDIKALIIQNTFGYSLDIIPVKSFCDRNNILIIEDLAHSAGSVYPNGKEVGTMGDFTALSFSQDKIIDVVSGGALVIRNNKFKEQLISVETTKVPIINQIRDNLYPLLTYLIRKLYPCKVGKALHYIIKNFNILSDPMGAISVIKYHTLPNWHASLAASSLKNLDCQIKHRKEIAKIYIKNLNKNLLSLGAIKNCDLSTNIRFPIFVEQRRELINYLKNNGIFVSDIWYDAPIAPQKLISKTKYNNGECPNAEVDAKQILNLPTHINVTNKDAERISILINKWLNTNQK
jgi:perosamine synthetase